MSKSQGPARRTMNKQTYCEESGRLLREQTVFSISEGEVVLRATRFPEGMKPQLDGEVTMSVQEAREQGWDV